MYELKTQIIMLTYEYSCDQTVIIQRDNNIIYYSRLKETERDKLRLLSEDLKGTPRNKI